MHGDMLDIHEIAVLLRCSDATVRRLIDAGKLKGERLSEKSPRRVRRSDLESYVAKQRLTIDWGVLQQ